MRLQGKVAVVTGASKGAGKATARMFAAEGAAVVLAARGAEALQEVEQEIAATGARVLAVPTDVAKWDDVKVLIEAAVERYSRVDILINNAGGSVPRVPVDEMSEDVWNGQILSNLTSVFYCTKAAVGYMKKQRRGSIVNVASIAGRSMSEAGGTCYAAAKAGVIGFTRQCAKELAPYGIRVNAMAPGWIATERMEKRFAQMDQREVEGIVSKIPLQRGATPEEAAYAILYLASDEAGYTTGATLDVNGGIIML